MSIKNIKLLVEFSSSIPSNSSRKTSSTSSNKEPDFQRVSGRIPVSSISSSSPWSLARSNTKRWSLRCRRMNGSATLTAMISTLDAVLSSEMGMIWARPKSTSGQSMRIGDAYGTSCSEKSFWYRKLN